MPCECLQGGQYGHPKLLKFTDRAFKLARKRGIKTAFGTDMLFSSVLAQLQGRALAIATGTNAELLQDIPRGYLSDSSLSDVSGKRPLLSPTRRGAAPADTRNRAVKIAILHPANISYPLT